MSGLIGFFLVFGLAGGCIAYAGDRLGTFVGKKRISRLGLRPKHTAILYTTISGGLIAVATVLILFGYDRSIRFALINGHALAATITKQRGEIARNQSQLSEDRLDLANARSETSVADQQLTESRRLLGTKQIQLTATEKALATGLSDLAATKSQLARTQSSLTQTAGRLAATSAQLGRTNAQLAGTEKQLGDADRQLASARTDYSHAKTQVALLKTQQYGLRNLNAQLSSSNAALEVKNNALSTSRLVYRDGDEIDRIVVPTGLSVTETEADLGKWLSTLNDHAVSSGVGVGADGRALLVDAKFRENDVAVPGAAPGETLPESAIVDALARSIAGQAGVVDGVVVQARASVNIVPGQPGRIALYAFDNVLLFSKNQRLATVVIDGRLPTDQILSNLQDFLTNSVRPVAQKAGVIPTLDHQTGEPSYGSPITNWMSVVKQIQAIGSSATVTAVAASDTFSAGPLRLSLIAQPAVSPGTHAAGSDPPAAQPSVSGGTLTAGSQEPLP